MFHLVESIRIEHQHLHHIELHNARFNAARKSLFSANDLIDLTEHIHIPEEISNERYKCRISTTDGMNLRVQITPYVQRNISKLKLVEMNDIDYSIKTDQRQLLDLAYQQRGSCDDVLIVKNKLITDSWAANVILFDGEKWLTPDRPLLKGIQREFLLSTNQIESQRISAQDLKYFKKIRLINALVDFERAPEVAIDQIVPE